MSPTAVPVSTPQPRITLTRFLSEHLADLPDATHLRALLLDVAAAVKGIAAMTGRAAIGGYLGGQGTQNVQGESQAKLDVLANDSLLRACEWGGRVAGMASEELDELCEVPQEYSRGPFLLTFDPLDGSSNIDVNVSIGTIFSILRHPHPGTPVEGDFLQPGSAQVAAGYAAYGPTTMLVLTVGRGTHGFSLDREVGQFLLTHPDMTVPVETREYSINASNQRHWEAPVQCYIAECQAGTSGPRGKDFNMRWVGSMVADVHRILIRGGVFLYPFDTKDPKKPGKLRLLYEANPLAFLVEQAGGRASTGRGRLMAVQPTSLHQRIPVILGAADEVDRLEQYHGEVDQNGN